RGRRPGRRRPSADASALSGRRLVHGLALAGAAPATAAGHLVYRRPGTALGLAPRHAATFVAFFDIAGLAALFVGVFRFVASGHRSPPFSCFPMTNNALGAATVP